MDVDALGKSPIGKLIPISGTDARTQEAWSYWAFVPAPLPTAPVLSLAAHDVSSRAAMEIARLDQAVSELPKPEILVRPIIRREAVSTSALEGTYADFADVLEADFIEERALSSEQKEIRNYVWATERGIELLKKYPISRRLAGELQSIIVKGAPGETYESGDIRQCQVAIGPKNRPIEEARFVPPPNGSVLEEGVSDWEKWVNSLDPVPVVIKMALAHYQFETLHPFVDGNGRLGRLIALLQLMEGGHLKFAVLNLAPWLEAHRDDYIDGLLETSKSGDFSDWVIFFAEAVRVQAQDGIRKIMLLNSLKTEFVQELRAANLRGSALQIAENLIGYPVIDVRTAQGLIGRSFEAANQAIARLVEQGILREITGRPQHRLFVCQRVLRIISS